MQPVDRTYDIVAVPADMPVIIPVSGPSGAIVPIVATAMLLEDQTPPTEISDTYAVASVHTDEEPVIAEGRGLTVNGVVI